MRGYYHLYRYSDFRVTDSENSNLMGIQILNRWVLYYDRISRAGLESNEKKSYLFYASLFRWFQVRLMISTDFFARCHQSINDYDDWC